MSPPRPVYRDYHKKLDWSLFNIKTKRNLSGDNLSTSRGSKYNNYSKADNIIIPSLDLLEYETNNHLNLEKRKYDAFEVSHQNEPKNNIEVVNVDHLPQLFNLTFNNKSNLLKRNLPSELNVEGPSIEIDNNQKFDFNFHTDRKSPSPLREIPEEKLIHEPEVVKIELRQEKLKEEESDLSLIVNELILWMKDNPIQFSDVIKRFVHYEEGDLTSLVKFEVNNKIYELYILCKENILEVRICLIENENSILLIDSGFKEKSNYFRKGSVNRASKGSISSFITRQETPSQESTTEFYQIFLSWWDTIKNKTKGGANTK